LGAAIWPPLRERTVGRKCVSSFRECPHGFGSKEVNAKQRGGGGAVAGVKFLPIAYLSGYASNYIGSCCNVFGAAYRFAHPCCKESVSHFLFLGKHYWSGGCAGSRKAAMRVDVQKTSFPPKQFLGADIFTRARMRWFRQHYKQSTF
jgi:hypothetical protein